MRLFDHDSGIMRFLGKVTDLAILNIVTLICCLPIITIGASITAMHYVALRMKRGTEGYVLRNFWKSFKENFKQATIIWLSIALITVISVAGVLIMTGKGGTFNSIVAGVLLAGLLGWIFISLWAYPLQAKFVNPILSTVRNAFFLSLRYIFKTLYMIIVHLLPVVTMLAGWRVFPIVFLFGLSVPAYFSAFAYDKIFAELEEKILERQEAEEGPKELGDWEAAEKRAQEEREAENKR